ncbi:lumican-like [Anneissia japonica]|uniref:lumican-like n=1 Tax=Anneissia japonica TaxID=1529436 RepID=UPI0014257ED6|nr:lumican-like [Anneissia japonica]
MKVLEELNMFGLLIFGLFYLKVTATISMQDGIERTCYANNPTQINGTQPPNTTVCPDSCSCQYCRRYSAHSVFFPHEVVCTKVHNTHIPTASIPVDVNVLDMKQNYIASISADSLAPFTHLQYLYLDYNSLQSTYMDDHIFDSQVNLKILHMDFNRGLINIHKAWFRNLVSLEKIYIRHSVVE